MKRSLYILCSAFLLLLSFVCLGEENAYDQLFKDKQVVTEKGVMTLHLVEGKVYLEIPKTLFGQHFLSASIVENSNDYLEAPVGYCPSHPVHFFFEQNDSTLLMRSVSQHKITSEDEQISQALTTSHIPEIIQKFEIKAYSPDSSSVVIDASSYFLNGKDEHNPLDPEAFNSMDGYVKRNGSYLSSNSFIESISAFDDHISVASTVSYKVRSAFLGVFSSDEETYLSARIRHALILMPDKKMTVRLADSRVGTGTVSHSSYSAGQQGMKRFNYVTRWDFNQGPLTFYIDDAFPTSWIPYIEASLDCWNQELDQIGCPDAIQYKMYSEAGPDFSPADLMNSCIRYIPSPLEKIMDHHWTDPSTGQILRADICINHGIIEKIQKDLFLQTAAANPKARKIKIDEKDFGEALSSILLKNIGHCLGLADNYAGSRAFPTDSLDQARFTQRHGISGSVMDVLPYNFVADSLGISKGVALMQKEPGIYDQFTLRYLYGKMKEEDLKELVDQQYENGNYLFLPKQNKKAFFDPRAMELDLGDNSLEAAKKGLEGLAKLVAGADQWLNQEDYDYQYRQMLYDELVNMTYEYVKQVFVNVGGIYVNDPQVKGQANYESISKAQQKEFMNWIMKEVSDMSWLENNRLAESVGIEGGKIADFCQKYYSRFIFSQIGEMYVSESKSQQPYTQLEAMQDVSDFVWRDIKTGQMPEDITQFQQSLFIDYLSMWTESDEASAGSSNIRFKTTPVRTHQWYGMLENTEKLVKKAIRRAKDDATRNHYRFLLHKIQKVL